MSKECFLSLSKKIFIEISLIKNKKYYLCIRNFKLWHYGSVVQLVRIRACHARGRGFESRPDRKNEKSYISFDVGLFFCKKKPVIIK